MIHRSRRISLKRAVAGLKGVAGLAADSLRPFRALFLTLLGIILSAPAQAHVKWFTEGTYADPPLSPSEIMTPLFWQLAILTVLTVAFGVWIDDRIQRLSGYQKLNNWLADNRGKSVIVMRIALAMTLLLSWQADAMLVPNVEIKADWIGWYQFGLAFLLLFPRTTPIAGAGTLVLYALGHMNFSGFHMMDYLLYLGVGWYLMVQGSSNRRLSKSGLMVLYLTVAFSLCWVAMEKFIYPGWAYQIMRDWNLTGGMDEGLFLMGAAFVEFGLGFLMLICMLKRPLAVLITAVFVTTTMVFGKTEIIGHTLIHGCLIVFLLEGGSVVYHRILKIIPSLWGRMAFATTSFVLLFPLLLLPYYKLSAIKYKNRTAHAREFTTMDMAMADDEHMHMPIEVPDNVVAPSVNLTVDADPIGGYNLQFLLENFRLTPERAGEDNRWGEGHLHLYLNGEKIARVYSPWYHLSDLPAGVHELRVTLHANNHQMLTVDEEPIMDREVFRILPEVRSAPGM